MGSLGYGDVGLGGVKVVDGGNDGQSPPHELRPLVLGARQDDDSETGSWSGRHHERRGHFGPSEREQLGE